MRDFTYSTLLATNRRAGGFTITFRDLPEAITQKEDMADDTRHYTGLDGFPHHKPLGGEQIVAAVKPPDLFAVLREIESSL